MTQELLVDGASLAFANKLQISLAIVVLLLFGGWLARRRPGPLRRWTASRVGTVGLVGVLLLFVGVASAALLVIWEVKDPALRALSEIDPTTVIQLVFTLALLAGAYIASGLIKRILHQFTAGHDSISRHQSEIAFRSIQLSVYVAAIIAVLGLWNFDLGGFLIGAGFLGIIVGMAARQTLGSVLAGFVLMFSRPFEIGDWVEIDDDQGIVTDITIVNTRLQTFDGEYVIIPNDAVGASTIVNRTRKGRLRIHVEVGVDYDSDVEHALSVAESALREIDDILSVPAPDAVLSHFGDSAVALELRFWIDKPNPRRRWRAQTAAIAGVKGAFEAEGIKIPYPQREVASRAEAGGFHVSERSPEPTEPDRETAAADGGASGDDE